MSELLFRHYCANRQYDCIKYGDNWYLYDIKNKKYLSVRYNGSNYSQPPIDIWVDIVFHSTIYSSDLNNLKYYLKRWYPEIFDKLRL